MCRYSPLRLTDRTVGTDVPDFFLCESWKILFYFLHGILQSIPEWVTDFPFYVRRVNPGGITKTPKLTNTQTWISTKVVTTAPHCLILKNIIRNEVEKWCIH